jgi:predicted sulfurtransferase
MDFPPTKHRWIKTPLDQRGIHLSPQDFHQRLLQPNTVVVDVRNHYEAVLGRFDGQEQHVQQEQVQTNKKKNDDDEQNNNSQVAKYVDPKLRKSTDFTTWLAQESTKEQLKDKQVLLYCTGGVRCERASAYVNQQFKDKIQGVYQLQGGVEHYLQQFPDGGLWRGKNFVFDKREAMSAQNTNGDGGVVKKHSKQEQKENDAIQTHCCLCETPWDRYVGKKKCDTCGVPVFVCDSCLSTLSKKKKTNSKGQESNRKQERRLLLTKKRR